MKSIKIVWIFLLFCCACTSDSKIAKKPVLKVNDTVLTAADFGDLLAQQLKSLDALSAKDPKTISRARESILQNFTVQVITESWAKNEKVFVRKEDLDSEINSIRSYYPNDMAFRRALAEENLDFDSWKQKIKQSLLLKLAFKKITSELQPPSELVVKEYYDNHKEEFQKKEQIKIRQIVLDSEANAKMVQDELKRGKALADLAKKFSIAPESKEGGLLGWVEKGTLETFDAAFNLRAGQKSQIIKSPYGYHIIEVLEKRSSKTMPFNEAKDRILRALMEKKEQAAYTSWLETQVRKAKVFRDQEWLDKIQVQTKGK